jgi:tetratricopeptide (TPR) repeat protein
MAQNPIEELVDQVEELRKESTKLREEGETALTGGLAAEAAAMFEAALEKMEAATALCRGAGYLENIENPTRKLKLEPEEKRLIKFYADCLGRSGGLLRRLGRLDAARDSYMAGAVYENDPRFGHADSYNTVNHLLVQLEMEGVRTTELAAEIKGTVDVLEKQTRGVRYQQGWAHADLGQCLLLAGRVGEAEKAFSNFVRLAAPKDIGVTLRVLRALGKRLDQKADPAARYVVSGIDLLAGIARRRNKLPDES